MRNISNNTGKIAKLTVFAALFFYAGTTRGETLATGRPPAHRIVIKGNETDYFDGEEQRDAAPN